MTTVDGSGLVLRREGTTYEPVATLDLPWAVRTSLSAPGAMLGCAANVRGLWDGRQIVVHQFCASEVEPIRASPVGTTTSAPPSRVTAAVSRLAAADALAAWRVDYLPSLRVVACVFDDVRASVELRDMGGVEVTRCRWSRAALRSARSLHEQVPDELLSAFGENTRWDGQPEVTIEVKYVTAELAALAAAFDGLVTVTGLLRRAEVG